MRRRVIVHGRVQGVGFRVTIARLADVTDAEIVDEAPEGLDRFEIRH